MSEAETVSSLLERGQADAPAILAPERPTLTYGALRALATDTVKTLNSLGIGRDDRVAIVLPNGPEMATAFVAIAAGATTAPLNPAYRADEFDFYLSDLGAKALVVEAGSTSPALEVAKARAIPIVTLSVAPGVPAGAFTLSGAAAGKTERPGMAGPDDIALVLHTSGTTSRPKIVPLSQRNICASARNIRQTLSLEAKDRCLNVMPLFHIHGLIAAVLSSLSAGASIYCTPGFNALKFFAWLDDAKPSWYTAVPTMHQAILARAERNRESIARAKLRFVRSSSSSLPPQVMAELEGVFTAPVVEAYGMTEASHQMASNPLPPRPRKAGTVGIAAGPEIAIMDEDGRLLKQGEVGEIVIRGQNVTLGYEANPKANASAFTNGWFRTGDQGSFDADGYLSLTGRLKEIINRGGEKISPREVDEVLMDHPAVAQAVTFALPHDKLGEEVAAAIVLREGKTATEREIRDFAAKRLADFKVPRKVLFLAEIPKGATGKLQRIGLHEKLAEQLGLAS
ncbi:MAG: acyl--CoA ligase [Candidatus Eiseniibacteriota bacterium]